MSKSKNGAVKAAKPKAVKAAKPKAVKAAKAAKAVKAVKAKDKTTRSCLNRRKKTSRVSSYEDPKDLLCGTVQNSQVRGALEAMADQALLGNMKELKDAHLNVNFRWELRMKLTDGMTLLRKTQPDIRCERTYTLYIRRSDKSRKPWEPWFELKPSNLKEAGYGLFSAREFKKGDFLGFFFWRESEDKCKGCCIHSSNRESHH
jgi:hypothetical protein